MGHAPIMHRAEFERFILTLPAAQIVRQWRDDSVAKVGGKIFALLDRDPGEIWFKASDLSFRLLIEETGIRPAPYFARASWVAVGPESRFDDAELRAYLEMAHRLIGQRLTRRVRTELGLDAYLAGKIA